MRRTSFVLIAVWLLASVACGSDQSVTGRYYKGLGWLEFRSDGTVLHGELGDVARFRLDAQDPHTVIVSSQGVETRGRVSSTTAIEFQAGSTTFADAFAGRWVKEQASPAVGDTSADAAQVAGEWRIAGETDVLAFKPDGSYQWGPRISGSYTMLGGRKIRMTLVHDGRPSGRLVQEFTVDQDQLKLTAPDGAVTTYQRVK